MHIIDLNFNVLETMLEVHFTKQLSLKVVSVVHCLLHTHRPSGFTSRLRNNHFFVTMQFWEYRFGEKKCVNDNKFKTATKQRKSNI